MVQEDMALSTQPYKGTRDFYPADMRFRNWMFGKLRTVVESFGYGEYDGPMLESFDLYAAKTGQEIVNQQLYSFEDQGGRKLAVRPEMTPTLARLVASKLGELARPIRLFSLPNLWRYERPQRGRLREHWQLNVDVLGGDTQQADLEILWVANDLMSAFGGADRVEIRVNHRQLIDHVFQERMGLDATEAQALTKLLDGRAKMGEAKYLAARDALGVESSKLETLEAFFRMTLDQVAEAYPCDGVSQLQSTIRSLKGLNLSSKVVYDPLVVRGMDYYTGMVFEIYDTSPENNRAMFGGGRYDNLVGLFGKESISGVGFGMGDVTLQHFLETHQLIPQLGSALDAYVTLPDDELLSTHLEISQSLRASGLSVFSPLKSDRFGKQLKHASKLGARFAVLLGSDELAKGELGVKDLQSGDQWSVKQSELAQDLNQRRG
jgi:histidyl-tRNA synthetase